MLRVWPEPGPGAAPLKHNWSGDWSRRITDEHRLICKPGKGEISIAQCRYHY